MVAAYPSPTVLLQAVRQAGRRAVARQLAALRQRIGSGQAMKEDDAFRLLGLLFPEQRQQQQQQQQQQRQQQAMQQPAQQQQQRQQQQQYGLVIDLTGG